MSQKSSWKLGRGKITYTMIDQTPAEPPLFLTPSERAKEFYATLHRRGKTGKTWSLEEAFERAVNEEIAQELIARTELSSREILKVAKVNKTFIQQKRFSMLRTGEYDMRRDPRLRKSQWYSFIEYKF
jgi:hypothetical protein